MAAVKRDFYEVLGVSRDADEDAIRRAFHDLARDWHPDVSDTPGAEERFRELAEAYSILSNREARLLYDRYGYRGRGERGFDEDLSEARPASAVRGENVHLSLELRSFEAAEGARRIVVYDAVTRCKACLGRGLVACAGEACSHCGGEGTVAAERRIRLLVPAGVQDGTQLRVSGDGNDAGAGSIPGDLLVRVKVVPPPNDPPVVRFAAFALLLVAIATLLLYVLL